MNVRCACSERNRPTWRAWLYFVNLGLVIAASGQLVHAADAGSSADPLRASEGEPSRSWA